MTTLKGTHLNIEQATIANNAFRHTLYTGHYSQLVLMSLLPGQEIGVETHGADQFFRFEAGSGRVIVDETEYTVQDGDCVVVPAGATHNVINTSEQDDLKLYTVYSIPVHQDAQHFATKQDAEAGEVAFDGLTTE